MLVNLRSPLVCSRILDDLRSLEKEASVFMSNLTFSELKFTLGHDFTVSLTANIIIAAARSEGITCTNSYEHCDSLLSKRICLMSFD